MLRLVFSGQIGELPTSRFDFMEDETKIGFIQIRHRPSHSKEVPANMASHIYYEIEPAFRGKGYGKKLLELGLREAKKIGLKEIAITCMEDNLASKKVIESNGGVMVDEAVIPTTGKKMLKYLI